MLKKIFAAVMSVVLVVGLCPTVALADTDDDIDADANFDAENVNEFDANAIDGLEDNNVAELEEAEPADDELQADIVEISTDEEFDVAVDETPSDGESIGTKKPFETEDTTSLSATPLATDDIASGTLGTCTWVIDSKGCLTISPSDGVSGNFSIGSSSSSSSWPWNNYRSDIKSVIVTGKVTTSGSMSYAFYNCSNLISLDVSSLDTSSVTNMRYMFYQCTNLSIIDVSNWDTSQVTNMSYMFYSCSNLSIIDVSNWDTSNVTNVSELFAACSSLTSLDLSSWDISSVTKMRYMFYQCASLTSLDLSSWDTSSVTDMTGVFEYCRSLASLDVSNWDTSSVTDMYGVFEYCRSLASLDVSNWDTSSVTSMIWSFGNCSSLASLDVSNWDTSSVTSMYCMFYNCSNLTSLEPLANWDTSSVTDMRGMFEGCASLSSLTSISPLANWDTSSVTNMGDMFSGCSSLTSISPLANWDTSSVTDMGYMFYGCTGLTSLEPLANWDTSSVTDMRYMFYQCTNLTSLDVSNWDTSQVTNMSYMFYNCSSLASLPEGFTIPDSVTDMRYAFYNCSSLTNLPEGFTIPSNATTTNAFYVGSYSTNNPLKTLCSISDYDNLINAYSWSDSHRKLTYLANDKSALEAIIEEAKSLNASDYTKDTWAKLETALETAEAVMVDDAATQADVDDATAALRKAIDSLEEYINTWEIGAKNASDLVATLNDDGSFVVSGTGDAKTFDSYSSVPWYKSRNEITSVIFEEGTSITNLDYWFYDCANLTHVGNLPETTVSLYMTFVYCSSLDSFSDGFIIPSGVTDMGCTFAYCSSLMFLPEGFTIPAGVTDARELFEGCSSLVSLPDNFTIPSSVTDIRYMFNRCTSLMSLPDNFSIPNSVTNMAGTFAYCSSLESLPDVLTIPTKVSTLYYTFRNCTSLTSLPDGFTIPSSATNLLGMCGTFYCCSSLVSLPTGFRVAKGVVNMYNAFSGCSSLTSLPDGFTIPSSVTDMRHVFENCASLASIPKGFTFPSSAETEDAFYVGDPYSSDNLLKTVCNTDDFETLYTAYEWTDSNRKLLVTADGKSLLEATIAQAESLDSMGYTPSSWEIVENALDNAKAVFADDAATQDEIDDATTDLKSAIALLVSRKVVKSWQIGAKNASDLVVTLYDDGDLVVVGTGDANKYSGTSSSKAAPWYSSYRTQIKSVEFRLEGDPDITSLDYWFYGCTNLVEIDSFPSSVTSLSYTFYGCSSLASLPDDFTIPAGVTDMSYAFYNCSSLETLPDGFTIPDSVTDIQRMFYGCKALKDLCGDFSIPSKTTNMASAFYNCTSLESLPASFFDTEFSYTNLNMSYAFYNCTSLETLPAGFTIPTGVTNISYAFEYCTALVNLPDSFTVPDSATDMTAAFYGCTSLESLPASFFDTEFSYTNLNMSYAFYNCTSLETLSAGFTIPAGVTNISYAFENCTSLANLPVGFTIPDSATDISYAFYGCSALGVLPKGFTISSSATNMSYAFYNCTSLANLPAGFTIPNSVTNMSYAFYNCTALVSLPAGFSIPASATTTNAFYVGSPYSTSNLLKTLCASRSDYNSLSQAYSWTSSRRNLVYLADDKSALEATIEEAESLDASNYNEPTWANLEDALTQAKFVFSDAEATQADVDDATSALRTAIDSLKVAHYVNSWEIGTPVASDIVATLYDDGSFVVSGTGDAKTYSSVSSIPWYSDRSLITSVIFEDGLSITNLNYWFYSCSNLTTVGALPKTAASLYETFQYCSSLTTFAEDFTIPESVTDMRYTFNNCTSLKTLPDNFTIPAGVESIYSLFGYCSSLVALPTNFEIPWGVTNMSYAFYNCTSLTTLPDNFTIPSGMLNIAYAFGGCASLTTLPDGFMIPYGVTNAGGCFYNCSLIETLPDSFAIPSTATSLGSMFYSCESLKVAPTIPSGTTNIYQMFYGCASLTKLPDIPTSVTDMRYAFYDCTSITYLPKGFTFPSRATTDNAFGLSDPYSRSNPLDTWCLESDYEYLMDSYDWVSSYRRLQVKEVANDRSALQSAIEKADSLVEDDYTKESWETLQVALSDAVTVYEDDFATQEEVDAAAQALNYAINTLVPAEGQRDTTLLAEEIQKAESLNSADYTPVSWAVMQSSLTSAKAVLEDTTTTQEEIDVAAMALEYAISSLVAVADTSSLSAAIARADALSASDYTPASWAVLQEALTSAKTVLDDKNATQDEVNTATNTLNSAISALVGVADTTTLEEAIKRADELNAADYTPASWEDLQAVLTEAKTILEDKNATQSEVNAATGTLNDAISALVAVADTTTLEEAIQRAEGLDSAGYTPASWEVLQEALTSAKTVLDDKNAAQSEVNTAAENLDAAIAALLPINPETSTNTMTVYAGADRYETANLIAGAVADTGTYDGVIVASAANGKFADALCASGLSGVLDYPVVLVDGSANDLDSDTKDVLSRLLPGKGDVIVLGGTSTVSDSVVSALSVYDSDGYVMRLAGDDRYATSETIYYYGMGNGGWSTDYAVLAKGNDFPDALGAASFCTTNAAPMLLTDQNSETLSGYVTNAAISSDEIVIVGGTSSVSTAKENTLRNYATVERFGENTRYETNLAFARWQLNHGMSIDSAGVATGTNFPDSLGSSYLLSLTSSVLLLTSKTESENTALYDLFVDNAQAISNISVFGGENSVSADTRTAIQSAIGGEWTTINKY